VFWYGPLQWFSGATDIVKEQALEEAIQESTNVDAAQISTAGVCLYVGRFFPLQPDSRFQGWPGL